MPQAAPLFTRRFVHLWTFAFVTFFSAFELFPAIPFRIVQLGGSKSEAGAFLAIYTYASAFSAPLTGALADAIGRRKLLVTASAAFIVFSILYGVITNRPLLLVLACVHGVLWSGLLSGSAALITETIPDERRTEGLAYWGLASTAAIAIAPAVGLWLYGVSWLALCGVMSALSIVTLVLSLAYRGGAVSASHKPMGGVVDLFDFRVTAVAMSLFALSFGYGGSTSYVAMMSAERHVEPRSLYFTVYALTIVVSRVFTARLGDRFGNLRLLYPSLALGPIAMLLLAFAHTRVMFAAAAVVFGLAFGCGYPAFVAWVLERSDPERRGSTFGSILWAFDTGIGTGSFALGAIAQRWTFARAFTVAAAVAALAIPTFVLTSKLLRRRDDVSES